MKKLFISLVAIAAAVFATSCTNDLVDSVNGYEGKTAKVGIEVSTPELATRTFGDGKSATNLYYGVYDEAGVLLPEISVIDTAAEINIKTTVNLELVTGDKYHIVFWAENAGSAATIDWANKKMTFDPTTASKEEYDAFYGKIDFTVDGPATLKADLFRPFAQVNIGTADYEKAQKAGMTVKDVMVKVKAFDTLDLFTAEATNVVEHEYAYAAAPTEAFPVADYEYMSMNYVLVNKAKHLVDVEMTYRNTENKEYNVVYGNVPVQRNYRTNIYGNLLTDQTGVIVEIKPAFEDDAAGVDPYIRPWDGVTVEQPAIDGNTVYIATGEQLAYFANAINTGATFDNAQTRAEVKYAYANVVLTHDIDLNKKAWTPIGNQPYSAEGQFRGTFDGQGHTIKGLKVKQAKYAGLFATAHNSFTVKDLVIDDFELEGNHYAGAILAWGEGGVNITNCVVKNGKVTVEPEEVDGKMDNGDKAGGLAGYIHRGVVKGCSVEDVTVKAYRDLGGLVGCANTAGTYEKNVVKNVEVIADQTGEYGSVKAPNAGELVGRAFDGIDLSTNYAEGVEVSINADAAHIDNLLNVKDEYVTINLTENVVINGECYREYAGAETKVLTINGNGFTLTYKDGYRTYIKLANPEGKLVLNNLKLYRETTNADIHYHNNNMSIYCNTDMNGVELNKGIILTNGSKFVFNNVNINKGKVATYAMFIKAGCDVTIDGMNITHSEGVNGRGIKVIDEDMTGEIPSTKLTIANTKFVTEEKAAVLVGSKGGANIVWGEGNDISGVKADTKFAVWVDEDWAAYDDLVTVTGCQKRVEGSTVVAGATPEEKQANFAAAVKEGATIYIPAGNYVVPNAAQGKTLTIIGTGNPEDVKIATDNVTGSYEGCNYALDGSTVTFENISINTPSTTYIGYARCNGTYKNCVINGTYTLYGDSVFENCTFNVSGDVYNIWTWGAPTATFTECTFNCDGKAMLLYGQANTKLTMNKCVFNDNGGLADLKAAIEIGNDYNKSYELIVNNATVNGFEINDKGINTNTTLWANKNSMPKEKLNVVVDGVDVY